MRKSVARLIQIVGQTRLAGEVMRGGKAAKLNLNEDARWGSDMGSSDMGSGLVSPHCRFILVHMVRPLRLRLIGGLYHVTSRRHEIFLDDADQTNYWLTLLELPCFGAFNRVGQRWLSM